MEAFGDLLKIEEENVRKISLQKAKENEQKNQENKLKLGLKSKSKSISRSQSDSPMKRKNTKKKRHKRKFDKTYNGLTKLISKNIIESGPSKWKMIILIESIYDIATGIDETDTKWYKLCHTRGTVGVNKYYKSIGVWLLESGIRFGLSDVRQNIGLNAFVSNNNCNFTILTQSGAKKQGSGSTKKFAMTTDKAKTLLKKEVIDFMYKQNKDSKNNTDTEDNTNNADGNSD
eukprot:483435_1